MVDRSVLSRIRQQRDLTAYHRRLTDDIGRWPALRALPQLLKIPLPIVDQRGALTPLRTALAHHAFVTLTGRPGSGRGLVMQQLALYHTRRSDPASPIPALLELPALDDGRSAPGQLLDTALHSLMQTSASLQARRLWRAVVKSIAPLEQMDAWLLFVHGWELLPPARRAAWRTLLLELPLRDARLRVVVALPSEEPAWSGYQALRITAPPPALVGRWLDELCPSEARAALAESLAPGAPLEHCAGRLFEVALLSWLAPRTGMPASQAELYQRALEAVRGNPQLFGGNHHAPLGHAQLGRFALARRIVDERRYALLATLPPPDMAETAFLTAALSADPTPVLSALWRSGRRSPETILALGRCVRVHAPAGPLWPLRVAAELGALARSENHALRDEAGDLLHALLPALDTQLTHLAQRERPARRLLNRLLHALPTELALTRAEALALTENTRLQQAWVAADVLTALCAAAGHEPRQPDGDAARSRWAYACIMSGQAAAALTEADLRALLRSAAGAARLAACGAALVSNHELPLALRLVGIELLEHSAHDQATNAQAADALKRACEDPSAAVRQAALAGLTRLSPLLAHEVLASAIHSGASWDLRLEALLRLGQRDGDAGPLVATHALDDRLPLFGRLLLLRGLVPLTQPQALLQIATDQRYALLVRAEAMRLAAQAGVDVHTTLLAASETPIQLLRAACAGLAGGAQQPRDEHELALISLLDRSLSVGDLETAGLTVSALGAVGGKAGSDRVSALLRPALIEQQLHSLAERLLDQPPEACLADPLLPPLLRLPLETALARSLTQADRPSTLREFLAVEADRLRACAARALGALGGAETPQQLRAALRQSASAATRACIAALAELEGLEALAELLAAPWTPQGVRWQIVEQIASDPAGEVVMRAALDRPDLEPFTRGALVEGLGQRGAHGSLLALTRLLRDPASGPHVLAQTVTTLGRLNEPATEPALLRIFADPLYDTELRGRAAASLPRALGDEGRQRLRDMLRTERAPGAIVAGALQALGRARDREALSLVMRYCLDDRAEVVRAAIDALADIGEVSVTPVLARTAQNPHVDRVVRIQAIGALLRLGGGEHRLLLQPYLNHSSPLIQLRALDTLIATGAPAHEISSLAADRERALPLRLRALEHVADAPEAIAVLMELVESTGDEIQLRRRAAIALGTQCCAAAVASLEAQAQSDDAALRLRCIEALGRIGGPDAWAVLSALAERDEQDPAGQAWALEALRAAGEAQQ